MKSAELKIGRTFGVVFEHGKDFFEELDSFCRENNVKQAFIPMFMAGFSEAELIESAEIKNVDSEGNVLWSKVRLENVDVLGGGTIAYDSINKTIQPHIHVSVGKKTQSNTMYTCHLLSAKVMYLTEMLVIEIVSPVMQRIVNPDLYNIALLSFLGDDENVE
ncbi:MAG: DUF296 domain-containing protein [Fibromonadaceae bacterium]|nr:DUF296 domain-containing protein [Fibromonadaceae bacterium]